MGKKPRGPSRSLTWVMASESIELSNTLCAAKATLEQTRYFFSRTRTKLFIYTVLLDAFSLILAQRWGTPFSISGIGFAYRVALYSLRSLVFEYLPLRKSC